LARRWTAEEGQFVNERMAFGIVAVVCCLPAAAIKTISGSISGRMP
jgi:hypothetical protein